MRDIDADQRRIDTEIGDDGGGDQRHRRAAQRREGLLHRHRAEREIEIEDGRSRVGGGTIRSCPAPCRTARDVPCTRSPLAATSVRTSDLSPDLQRRNDMLKTSTIAACALALSGSVALAQIMPVWPERRVLAAPAVRLRQAASAARAPMPRTRWAAARARPPFCRRATRTRVPPACRAATTARALSCSTAQRPQQAQSP